MQSTDKTYKCPICGKEHTDNTYRPFCSKRCADIDLGKWFNGDYSFEAVELDEQDIEDIAALHNAPDQNNQETK